MYLASELGTYLEHEGRPAVRFVRTYPHPIDRVWRAVSEPAELVHWFPSTVAYEPRAGGTVTFSGDPYAPDASGVVLAYEPPRRFGFTWGDGEVHLALDPVGDGSCRLTLINVLADRSEAARNASGWLVCLDELRKAVDGTPGAGPHGAETLPWEPVYRAHLDAGLPSGAEVPDIAQA